jgi:hypothetical protein
MISEPTVVTVSLIKIALYERAVNEELLERKVAAPV